MHSQPIGARHRHDYLFLEKHRNCRELSEKHWERRFDQYHVHCSLQVNLLSCVKGLKQIYKAYVHSHCAVVDVYHLKNETKSALQRLWSYHVVRSLFSVSHLEQMHLHCKPTACCNRYSPSNRK